MEEVNVYKETLYYDVVDGKRVYSSGPKWQKVIIEEPKPKWEKVIVIKDDISDEEIRRASIAQSITEVEDKVKVEFKQKPIRSKSKVTTIIFVVLFISLIGYTILNWNNVASNKELEDAFKIGAQYGYQSGILEIFNEAAACRSIPLNNSNISINLIAAECLTTK